MIPNPATVALLDQAREALELIERLASHVDRMESADAAMLFRTAELIRRRLEREHLVVAVVGEKKSGKSTFLNALLGARLLGVAVRECTGTITELRRGDEPDWRAELESGKELRFSADYRERRAALARELAEMVGTLGAEAQHNAFVGALSAEIAENERELLQRFAADVQGLTDMRTSHGEVALLEITWPARRLPPEVVLLDSPGVNTDDARNVERAWQALEVYADGCLLLSDMQQAMSASTLEFLEKIREIVPHVALVLTKVDRAMENAEAVGGDPEEELREARRVAERRFAEQSGRDPSEILAFAVAAEAALVGSPPALVEAFDAEIARLFAVLREERALVIASRAAAAFQRATVALERAADHGLSGYQQHIEALNAQRIPEPEAFIARELLHMEPLIERRAAQVADALARELPGALLEVDATLVSHVRSAPSRDALAAVVEQLDEVARRDFQGALRDMQRRAGKALDQAWSALYPQALSSLRERYQIVDHLRISDARFAGALPDLGDVASAVNLNLSALTEAWGEEPLRWGVAGAAVGSILGLGQVGSFSLPAAVAASINGISNLFSPLEREKDAQSLRISAAVEQSRASLEQQLRAAKERVAEALRAQIEHALRESIRRYSAWIAGVIDAEERRIAFESERMGELAELVVELRERESSLRAGMAEVARLSRAL